ncbi:MAG: zinc ribbon domain-containing protein [Anaerolineaceae bacterium]|nr:zinc ribbon domain-containing protein [Anaerolineaceae bacterium]
MQICSKCNTNASDENRFCPSCQADLQKFSVTAVYLADLQNNSRVRAIILSVSDNACPACKAIQGTYTKETVPILPVQGCSEPQGCTCTYQPVLSEIYP